MLYIFSSILSIFINNTAQFYHPSLWVFKLQNCGEYGNSCVGHCPDLQKSCLCGCKRETWEAALGRQPSRGHMGWVTGSVQHASGGEKAQMPICLSWHYKEKYSWKDYDFNSEIQISQQNSQISQKETTLLT